ncbi:MAG: MoxR family ATPase [Thiomargarita sp.]|nr:MoxR family ATPase [Thiomargarita sp.]
MLRHRLDTKTVFSMNGYNAISNSKKEIEKPEIDFVLKKLTQADQETVHREPYHADDSLIEVVNLAISLGRPLLLHGDPGCGKTRLAYVIAFALSLPLEEFYIKSTSRAQDLLYTYDAVNRLYDAQISEAKSKNIKEYIKLGPLGRAIARAQYGRRSVVLLDEIDKADLDFPNDLLWELDRLEFRVNEARDIHYAIGDHPELRPIIVVTHNEEKPLPPAFLRRCIFHHIEFPEKEGDLLEILHLHEVENDQLSRKAATVIQRLRDPNLNLAKKPGLSELIDWVKYLEFKGMPPEQLDNLPFISALLKLRDDQEYARKHFQ